MTNRRTAKPSRPFFRCRAAIALLGLLAGAGEAAAQGELARLSVLGELAGIPPDDGLIALEIQAEFELSRAGTNPPDDGLTLDLVPGDPAAPGWRAVLPRGCFREVRPGQWRADGLACGGRLEQVFADGSARGLGRYLVELGARMGNPPDDTRWTLRLRVETRALPADAVPPDPIRGGTVLQVAGEIGGAVHEAVEWAGRQMPLGR